MTKDNTWFDAFFQALTTSPEFKAVMETDFKKEFWEWIDSMKQKATQTANELKNIQEKFKKEEETYDNVENVFEDLNNSFQVENKKEEIQKDDKKAWWSVFVQYFTNTNPETWWFAWIAWMSDLKNELQESFIKPLKFKFLVQNIENQSNLDPKKAEIYKKLYEEYEKFKISIPTWLLFYWPPGTWKTFITKKLAQELWAGLIVKSAWEFGSAYQHQTSQNIKNFFAESKKEAEKWPIILFLDEIDSILSKRTNNIDASKAEEVSQFLQEFNNLAESQNLIVIAATNRPDHLDSAILRSWRLDKKIYIWPPDFIARKELFEMYIKKEWRPHDELDFDELALLTEWYVAADIETICDEVSRDASSHILDLAKNLEWENFDEAKIFENLSSWRITMDLLKQAIKDTTSSLKMVDMNLYNDWIKSLES